MARPGSQGTEPPDRIRFSWSRSDRPVPRRVLRPLQSFLETEAAGSALLLLAAVVALGWANSPWRESYEDLWRTVLSVRVGRWAVSEDLRQWVNDGLMALFFLVVGLEIKRELLTGELRDRRAAMLPVIAALGGMLLPAAIYLVIDLGGEGPRGWGIVMPSDIVFTLGILALAAPGAPPGLKVFVLALAIVDDLLSLVVMALFYSGGLEWGALAVAAALVAVVLGAERIHIRASAVYVTLGVGLWLALHASGVTAVTAGVIMAFLTPAEPFQRPRAVSEEAHRVADETVDDPYPPDVDAHHWLHLTELSREAVSPLARVEAALHPWTSFLIAPIFVLANAGVQLSASALSDAASSRVAIGIVIARMVGKTLGIALAVAIVVRLRLTRLPAGAGWTHIVGVGAAAGIPFTVSFFVAELAFADEAILGVAKIGILVAALLAGALGFALLSRARSSAALGSDGEPE